MDDDNRSDGLADLINLLAAPIAGSIRSVEQAKRGFDEMWRAAENLNATMETLNETAQRVNALLAEVEEPIKAMMPQLTRTIRTADEITQRLEGPVRAAAPNIEKIAGTLSAPGFATLPSQLADVLSSVSEVSRRLSPLAVLAENAGGLFGGFRLPGAGGQPAKPAAAPKTEAAPKPAAAPEPAPAPKKGATKGATKKSPAKKSPAKKKAGLRVVPGTTRNQLTKGSLTTVPGRRVPRTSTSTAAPASVVGSRNAIAMP